MRFRKLRIAWSVFWGLVAVLLIALWARSYWHSDYLRGTFKLDNVEVVSDVGRLLYTYAEGDYTDDGVDWLSNAVVDVDTDRGGLPLLAAWKHVDTDSVETPLNAAGFYTGETSLGYAIMVPHWFAALTIGTLAAVPWIRWSRRFSLRTLLIATTLVAVVLGLIVWLR